MAIVATNIVYLAGAQFLPSDCCQVSRIATHIALGLPAAVFCAMISHAHICSRAHIRVGVRKIALWAAWISLGVAINSIYQTTNDFLEILNPRAGKLFWITTVVIALLLTAHWSLLRRGRIVPENKKDQTP
jgi:hypothetical protein